MYFLYKVKTFRNILKILNKIILFKRLIKKIEDLKLRSIIEFYLFD